MIQDKPINEILPEAKILSIATHTDERGNLTCVQNGDNALPFKFERVFWITGVPAGATRGCHAHRTCPEVIVPVHGSFSVKINNGKDPETIVHLSNPNEGLYVPPMVWCTLFDFSADAVCLCLAQYDYDESGYIQTLGEFAEAVNGTI